MNRRGVIAAVLGLLYPGLGHVYLRRWLRALSWFLVAFATAALVVPDYAYTAFQTDGFNGLVAASERFGLKVTLSLLAVRVLNVVDAYVIAVRDAAASVADAVPSPGETDGDSIPGDASGESEGAGECPNCGKELDAELDFCPWCTTRLETGDGESQRVDSESQ